MLLVNSPDAESMAWILGRLDDDGNPLRPDELVETHEDCSPGMSGPKIGTGIDSHAYNPMNEVVNPASIMTPVEEIHSTKVESSPKSVARILNRKATVAEKPIYPTLAQHQRCELEWDYHSLSEVLDTWYDRFNDRFRLSLPRVPLRLDSTIRRNCAGYFRPGYNEFGLVYEIAVAVPPPEQLSEVDIGAVIGTLLHEQLHLLQELTGVPGQNNYHNAQFRDTAERFGLLVDYRGHQSYSPDSPFLDLLAEFGVAPPLVVQLARATALGTPLVPSPPTRRSGRSKLHKWSCGCTNVWVGVAVLSACCAHESCGKPFQKC